MHGDPGAPIMKPISFSEPEDIFQNGFLHLYSVKADFGETQKEYFIVDKGRRVGVILRRDDEIMLVRQYRYLVNDMSWELPGGGINDGETPEEAAVRECREEAGVECGPITPVFFFHQGIDTTLSPAHIFECREFSVLKNYKNDETDDRKWVPLDQTVEMVLDGRIKDSMSLVGLLTYDRIQAR